MEWHGPGAPHSPDCTCSSCIKIEYPAYNEPGRILVRVLGPYSGPAGLYKHDYEVLEYDIDSSVFYIMEGTGLEWWLDQHCDFPCPGLYVISGITGEYIRGNWSWGEDDDERWDYEAIRPGTVREYILETME